MIKAVAQADQSELEFWTRTIEKGKQQDGDLDHALSLMKKYQTLETTRREAIDWANQAKSALAKLPDHPVRTMLVDLADYVVERIN